MHSAGRQRYYSAIVREAAARRALDGRSSEEGVLILDPSLYEDIGKKSLAAFTNLLDALSGARASAALGQRDPYSDQALQQQLSSLVDALEGVRGPRRVRQSHRIECCWSCRAVWTRPSAGRPG